MSLPPPSTPPPTHTSTCLFPPFSPQLNAAKDIISLNPAGFTAIKSAATKAKNFKDGARVVAQGVCMGIWTALELGNPIFSFIYNLVTMFASKCGMLKNLNPAISLGITLDVGVGSFGYAANIGAEFGVAIDKNGNRMCYLGYCVSSGIAVSLPPAPPASADVGVMLSFWGDAGSIPGTLNTIEFSVNAQFASFGIALDLIYMYAGSIGDFLGIGISAEVGPGKAALAGGMSLMTGKCDTPLCLTTCGEDCGGGRPTCGYTANAAAAKLLSTTGDVRLQGTNNGGATNLQACIGECDADTQCAAGLKCFQREHGEKIPGCSGTGSAQNWDYCYDPLKRPVVELQGGNNGGATNLQACIGECDADTQCAAGLKCFQREHGEKIPGCSGTGSAQNWDYCYDPNVPTYGAEMTSVAHPPSVGQGDRGTSDGTGILQIRSVDGKCLDASQRNSNGGKVHMWQCDIHNENQHWTYNRATSQIKSRKGICLDASQRGSNGGKIHMWPCNTNNANQQFDFAAGINQIKNKHGICVAAGGNNQGPTMQACPDWAAYLRRYPDLKAAFGSNTAAAQSHYIRHGKREGRNNGPDTLSPKLCKTEVELSQRKINGGKVHMWSCDANNKNQMWTMQRCEVQDFLSGVNGWSSYGHGYGGAESFVSEGICTVSGLIKGGQWGHVATLPANCRPNKRLIFNLNNHAATSRVDVHTNGQVHWVAGGKAHAWLSLTGITFAPGSPIQVAVSYNNGWSSYGQGYGGATATVSGGTCMVSGRIKGTFKVWQACPDWAAYLRRYPDLKAAFGSNTAAAQSHYNAHGKREGRNNGPDTDWAAYLRRYPDLKAAYGSNTAAAQSHYNRHGKREGRNNGPDKLSPKLCKTELHVATLPANCRPNKRLIFNLNNHAATSRVDVLTNGEVRWVTGGKSHGWLSLTGITFAPGSPAHEAVPYNNGWRSHSFGGATATVSGGSCMVSGLITGGTWGHLATLPENCRPNRRLIFNLNNHQYTSRVDVHTNGQVHWVAGGQSHGWLSLTGITFTPEGSYRCT
jgi:hypothetical protein